MDTIVHPMLNQNFEILGLLYMSQHPEYLEKDYYLATLQEQNIGVSGDALYQKLGRVLKRYVGAFQKEMVMEPAALFFFEDSLDSFDSFIILLQVIFAAHPEWVDAPDATGDEDLWRAFTAFGCEEKAPDAAPSFYQIIEMLKTSGFSTDVCWKLTVLLQTPKAHILQLAALITANIPAYRQALAAVEKPLAGLLAAFPHGNYLVAPALAEGGSITPSLIHPAVEVIDSAGNAFVGVYSQDIYNMMQKAKTARSSMAPVLKVLSDQSKFDILLLLKTAPRYNLELAEELHLTAATVSHHMSALLTHNLVTVEKHGGRVYYSLQKETLLQVLAELQGTFS